MSVHQAVEQPRQLGNEIPHARLRLADAAAELGALLGQLGDYTEAEPLLRHAVRIYQSRQGRDHLRLAAALTALSGACAARGRLVEAERLSRRALHVIDMEAQERQ